MTTIHDKLAFAIAATALLAACQNQPAPTTKSATDASARPASPFAPTATFDVENRISVPVQEGAKEVRVWFPLPREEDGQKVSDLKVEGPTGWTKAKDDQGNQYVYATVT